MNDQEFEKMIKNNVEAIRQHSNETRQMAKIRIDHLENLVKTMQIENQQMRQHISLLLTKNFNHEATSE